MGPPAGTQGRASRRLTPMDLIQQVIAEDCPALQGVAEDFEALAQQPGNGRPGRIRDVIKKATDA